MFKIRYISFTLLFLLAFGCNPGLENKQLTNTQFNFITTDSIKIPVKISGKGSEVCMFVPGGPGGGYLSFEQLGGNTLENNMTMVYMDQRGSGDADSAKDYSMDRMLKDMDELRAKLGIDKMFLMSHSFGGVIMINYAKQYPQHVKGLIFVNSTLYFFSPQSLAGQIAYGYSLLGKDTIITSRNADSLFTGDMIMRQKLSEVHKGYKLLTDSISTIAALEKLDSIHPRSNDFAMKVVGPILDKKNRMLYPEYLSDYTSLSKQILAPVLIINGTKDHAIGPDHYKLFQFPKQKVVQIEGGHLLYYEQNKLFADAVEKFITDVDDEKQD